MKLTTFQNVVPVACARIPVKLKFAKIQTAEAPPSVPLELDESMVMDLAMDAKTADATAKVNNRYAICRTK